MTNPSRYRRDLPDIPPRMLTLPVECAMPVPWFVGQVDDHYDFRPRRHEPTGARRADAPRRQGGAGVTTRQRRLPG